MAKHEIVLDPDDTVLVLFRNAPGISLEVAHDMLLEAALDTALAKLRMKRREPQPGDANITQQLSSPALTKRW